MKNTSLILGVVAFVAVPLAAHAGTEKAAQTKTAAAKAAPRETIYITNKSVTGSHIPLVVTRYNGQYTSNSPISVYGQPDLDRTGQLNVQGELNQRDPAISSVMNFRR